MLFDVKKKIKKQNKTKYGFVKTKTNCSFWDVALVLISVIRKLLRVNSIWSMWKMLMSMITRKKMSDFLKKCLFLKPATNCSRSHENVITECMHLTQFTLYHGVFIETLGF